MASPTKCGFHVGNRTDCSIIMCGKETFGHALCGHHYHIVLEKNLCQNCFAVKQNPKHRVCQDCFRKQRSARKQEAIDSGKCVNYWKCSAPAEVRNGMCYDCYRDYVLVARHEILPPREKKIAPIPEQPREILVCLPHPPVQNGKPETFWSDAAKRGMNTMPSA